MTQVRALSLHGINSISASRAFRAQHIHTPLPAATVEQVKVSFYAPALTGTNLAEGLLRAAKADVGQMENAEWRATMQQAMDQIRASCAALHAIAVAQAAHESFPTILASVDELERFLRLAAPLVGVLEPEAQRHQVNLATRALEQAALALKRIDKTVLRPACSKSGTKKRPTNTAPRHLAASVQKSADRPGWLQSLMPKRKPKNATAATAAAAPLPRESLPKSMSAPLLAPPPELPGRPMTDGLKLLSSSGQWIEQAVQHDTRLKSEITRREYIADLYVFNAWRRDRPFSRELIQEYTESLEQTGYSPEAVEQMLQALRWLAGCLAQMASENAHIDAAERQDILISATQVIGFRQARSAAPPPEPYLAQAELTSLLYSCAQDASWQGIRDAALVALTWAANLKPSLLANLKVTGFRCEGGEGSLVVRRGIKDDVIPLPAPVTQAILKWLSVRRYNLGPLFYTSSREGNIRWGYAMTEKEIVHVIETRILAARIASTIRTNEG